MRVSVLTPIFERAEWEPVLQSIVDSQTYPIAQWLICEEKKSRSAKDRASLPRLSGQYILTAPRLTVSQKLNLMLGRVEGDLVVYFSSDDYYHPDYIRSVVQHFIGDPLLAGISLSSMDFYDLRYRERFTWDTTGSYSAALAHRASLPLRFPHRKLTKGGEDRGFITELAARYRYCETVSYQDKIIVLVHGTNLSTRGEMPADRQPDRDHAWLQSRVPNKTALDFYERW